MNRNVSKTVVVAIPATILDHPFGLQAIVCDQMLHLEREQQANDLPGFCKQGGLYDYQLIFLRE
jgi:hypothetical protein